jgi:uncharacterized membrane protein
MAEQQISYNQPQQSTLSDSVLSEASAFVSDDAVLDMRSQTRAEILRPSTYEQSFQLASRQEQIIYDQKGLDYASNLPFVNKRDAAGNLIINGTVQQVTDKEGAQYNETVIVEANDRLYTNSSVNRVIDTQFKYFKFPPTIISRQTDIGEIDVELPENELDVFSARYTPDFVQQWFVFAPSYAVPGKRSGFQKLEFNNILRGPQQIEPGTYTITPELIESGKNLRMRYKVDVHYANPDVEGDPADEIELYNKQIDEVNSIITTYENTISTLQSNPVNSTNVLQGALAGAVAATVIPGVGTIVGAGVGAITAAVQNNQNSQNNDFLIQVLTDVTGQLKQLVEELKSDKESFGRSVGFRARLQRKSADYQPALEGSKAVGLSNYVKVISNGYDSLSGEYLLENRDMRAWDKWYIEGNCGTNDTIVNGQTKGGLYFADQCYWEIEAVDS